MKKVLNIFASMVAITMLFASCSKSTDKILTKKDGKWDFESTFNLVINGVVDESYTSIEKGEITFDDDKFIMTYPNETPFTGKWHVTKDKVTLYDDEGGDVIIFDIVESKKKSQIWLNTLIEIDEEYRIEHKTTFKLTR